MNLEDKCSKRGKIIYIEQIEYMKSKGITFKYIDESDAMRLLSNNTYYYKVTAFRKNFKKRNGKYINLDFGNLNDLATIDMYLRYISIKLLLDLEHALKSLVINIITKEPQIDGYDIVRDYNEYCKKNFYSKTYNKRKKYKPVWEIIMSRSSDRNGYHYELFEKRKDNPPIWVLVELMSYGELIRFIEYCCNLNKYDKFKGNLSEAFTLIKYTRNFRNAAAHSRPLLINICDTNQMTNAEQSVTEYAAKAGVIKLHRKKHFKNMKIHDFCCILILHDKYIKSDEMKTDRKNEMIRLVNRCSKRNEYYANCEELKNVFNSFSKIVDYYYQK